MDKQYQVQQIRRKLKRLGMGLPSKRNPYTDESGYMIIDLSTNTVITGGYPLEYGMTLEDVEEYVSELDS